MPADVKKFPLYVIDEPAIYDSFLGGINTDPSSENLDYSELRDALNMHYNAGSLEKRKGASQVGSIVSEEPLENIQGVFLFTYRITYLIVAANGRLYSGVFNKNSVTNLRPLRILVPKDNNNLGIDPQYMGHGLETLNDIDPNIKHEGYLKDVNIQGLNTKELIFQNTREIEAATYNNKMYITTGTRFIEVVLDENQLKALPVSPYLINNNEFVTIGPNHLSPFPHIARNSAYNQAITSIGGVRVDRTLGGTHLLRPIMTFHNGDQENDYYYRWEKYVDSEWVVIISYKDNYTTEGERKLKINRHTLEVTDADRFKYRVTFGRGFKTTDEGNELKEETIRKYFPVSDTYNDIEDYVLDRAEGEWFGQASTVLFDNNIQPFDYFNVIQSCTKITSDGNKFLLYGDRYNSGSWFKTVIDNPGYITYRGGLSFKTTKNEELVKVVAFNNNLVAFANSPTIGGSIHIIVGNGDDYEDDFYSPYRRRTITSQISCDNPKTIQVAENLLIFKYFKNIYYIRSSELNNEVIRIYTANEKIKLSSRDVKIPWEDNSCYSEITEDYYALIWKEKYILEDGELILDHPAMRIKMYYKMSNRTESGEYYPWLRDESKFFITDHILYLEGTPIYLYNNVLLSFHEEVYKDMDENFPCRIMFKGVDLNYPKMFKIVSDVLIAYHHNHFAKTKFDVTVRNEAGHILIDSQSKRFSIQDLKGLKVGTRIEHEQTYKLDKTIMDSKLLNALYQFPCLLAETTLDVTTDKEFSIASITYNYTTMDVPNVTPYDLYTSILRKKEV